MIDTTEEDNNSLLEYFVTGAVILFFGGLYYYINFGSQFNTGHTTLAPSAQSQSLAGPSPSLFSGSADLALAANAANDNTNSETMLTQGETGKPEALQAAADSPEITSGDKAANEQTANEAKLQAEKAAQLETQKSQLETDVANLEADRKKLLETNASLAKQADENTQKIADAKQSQQAALATRESTKNTPTQQPENSGENIYMLPDGRKVDIANKGFEGMLKQALNEKIVDTPIIFDGIYFESGAAEPNQQSQDQILATTALMHTYKDVNILIKGHSDDIGSTRENTLLSLTRSNYMKNALVRHGIDARRIKVQGVGSLEPIAPNNTAEGRNTNRRIELILID